MKNQEGVSHAVFTCTDCGRKMGAEEALTDKCEECGQPINLEDHMTVEEIVEVKWWAIQERKRRKRWAKSVEGWADSFE